MGPKDWKLDFGANPLGGGEWAFRVWAPFSNDVKLILVGDDKERASEMRKEDNGYFSIECAAEEGMRYAYLLNGALRRPDPASRYQPDGINGDSGLVDPFSYHWSDDSWTGIPLSELIVYELHVGTATLEGTFSSLIPCLDYFSKALGVTAIEIMPVAQFPGGRNWGYDGTMMYSVQNTYGGPLQLKKLVDSCHALNLAVILDVVYNHVGPEGNCLRDYGPYFSNRYQTPWGPAINYDGSGSDEVRNYVVNNALYWLAEYHVDGLRLDAIQGIFDFSSKHILQEIRQEAMRRFPKRQLHLIAESDLNDPKVIRSEDQCGYGLDAQWSDDFHHSVHAYMTGERNGYYSDYGKLADIAKALREGFVYDGRYSKFRDRIHGASSAGLPGSKFVICIQNHDQIGNRPEGKRLASLLEIPSLKVAAGLLILSPCIPLLFMGEEYAEKAPFYFFTSHIDPAVAEATREGRKNEFKMHDFDSEFVDPQDVEAFERSKIDLETRFRPKKNEEVFQYYRELISLRKAHPAFRNFEREDMEVKLLEDRKVLTIWRRAPGLEELVTIFVLNDEPVKLEEIIEAKEWKEIYCSNPAESHSGTLLAMSVTVFQRVQGSSIESESSSSS